MPRYLVILLLALPLVVTGEGLLSTQSGTAAGVNTWTEVFPTGITASNGLYVPGWETLQYFPAIKKHCTLALFREINGESNRALHCLDLHRNHLSMVDNSGFWHGEHMADGGHPTLGVQVNPATSQMMGVFNNSGSQVSEARRWTYVYDIFAQTGRMRQANSVIGDSRQMGGAFDVANNRLVVHGGDSGFIGTSVYDPDSNTWSVSQYCTAVASNCPTPGTINPSLAYRSVDKKIYLFGGVGGGQVANNNVYVYTHGSGWAQKTTAAGSRPVARQYAGWVYLERDDVFLMFGGHDASNSTGYNDTWIYDPTADQWTQLTPTSTPTFSGPSWSRLSYDKDLDAVVNLQGTVNGIHWYIFRYRDGAKIGYAGTPSYNPTSGGQNRSTTGWAQSPSVATNGTTAYHAWVESGSLTDVTNGQYHWPYAQSVSSGGTRTSLGSAYNSMANESATLSSDTTRLAYGSSNLWACWEQGNSNITQVNAKMWSGSAWTSGGIVDATPSGGCDITVVGTTPYVVYKKRETAPGADVSVYVRYWNGSAWTALGGRLNVNSPAYPDGTVGESVAITNDGTNPCVAWTEYTNTETNKLRVKCWNGSAWSLQGTTWNVNSSNLDYFPAITRMGTDLYVAFIERPNTGASQGDRALLYVRKWNGSAVSTVGSGAINRDTNTGWAFRPRITNDGTNLYVAFAEQFNQQSQGSLNWVGSYAQRPSVQVAKYNGSAWSFMGGSLNADTSYGAAVQPDIAMAGTNPTVTWAEVKYGSMRQVYAKQWNGTDFAALTAAAPVAPTITTSSPLTAGTQGVAYSNTISATGDATITFSVTVGALPTGLSLASNGTISGTPSGTGTSTFTVTATNGVSPDDSKAFSLTINAAGSAVYRTIRGVTIRGGSIK